MVTIIHVVLLISARAGLIDRARRERESQEAAEWFRAAMAKTEREAAEASARDEA